MGYFSYNCICIRVLNSYLNSYLESSISFQAMTKRKEAEDRSTELELKLVGLQELLVTLKDVKGAEKVLLFSLYSVLFYHETSIRLGSYDGFLRRHM